MKKLCSILLAFTGLFYACNLADCKEAGLSVPVGGMIPYCDSELPPQNKEKHTWAWADGKTMFPVEPSVPVSLRGAYVPDMQKQFVQGVPDMSSGDNLTERRPGTQDKNKYPIDWPNPPALFYPQKTTPEAGAIKVSTSEVLNLSVQSDPNSRDNIVGQTTMGLFGKEVGTQVVWLPVLPAGLNVSKGPINVDMYSGTSKTNWTSKFDFYPVVCSKLAVGGVHMQEALIGKANLPIMTGDAPEQVPSHINVKWIVRIR